ncbi:MAG TPA: PPOX class F420-dependent oxidoreductase [Chloroflexia bacterium]|nr:PPOX class F420-dependent oxidoreductase [Chloroflexia bacterium]
MNELTDAVRAFLGEKHFAVAATINKDGTAQQTVVWYELQGDRIMMNTRVGRLKERNLKRDDRISVCVLDGYKYITIKGRAEFDYDPDRAHADITALAVRYHGQEKGEAQGRDTYGKQERVTIYLPVERLDVYGL